ncbi:MAG: hypothetical protein ACRYGL_01825 [Janthinobacterium lividum]
MCFQSFDDLIPGKRYIVHQARLAPEQPALVALPDSIARPTYRRDKISSHAREPANAVCPGKLKLVAVFADKQSGDESQSSGMAQAIRAELLTRARFTASIQLDNVPLTGADANARAEQLRSLHREWNTELRTGVFDHIVVVAAGAGEHIVSTLGELAATPGIITVFGGHQLSDDIRHAAHLPTVTVLPLGTVTPTEKASLEKRTTVVLVSGVASRFSKEQIAEEAARYKAKGYPDIPDVGADTVAVILGGDAPDEGGRLRLFTADDARHLAARILAIETKNRKQVHFIVVNSPRTGRHALDLDGKPFDPHASGVLDPVTQSFVETLRQQKNCSVAVFDYQRHASPSALAAIIDRFAKAGRNAGNMHVPGDSPSMIAETSGLPRRIFDDIGSMNESHRKVVQATMASEGGQRLDERGNLTKRQPVPRARRRTPAEDVATTVADLVSGECPIRTERQV